MCLLYLKRRDISSARCPFGVEILSVNVVRLEIVCTLNPIHTHAKHVAVPCVCFANCLSRTPLRGLFHLTAGDFFLKIVDF